MIKSSTIIGCLLLLASTCLADYANNDVKFKKIVCQDSSEIAVIKSDLDYPISGTPSMVKALQQDRFEKGIKFYETGCHQSLSKDYKELATEGGFQFEFTSEDKVYVQNRKVIIYRSFDYRYDGGAHGMYGYSYDTYLKPNGEKFKIDSTAYKDVNKFREVVWDLLIKNNEDFLLEIMDYGTTMKTLPISSNIYFSKDSLSFHYYPYEIAPWAAGMPEIKVPYEVIIRLLKPRPAKILKEIQDSFR